MYEEEHHNFLVRLAPHIDSAVQLGTRLVPVNLARSDPDLVHGTASVALDRESIAAQNHGNTMACISMPWRCLTGF
jgi:hypothetical protein